MGGWIKSLGSVSYRLGLRFPNFELTLPRLFPLFHGHKVGMLFMDLATSRQVPELRPVLVYLCLLLRSSPHQWD